MKSGKQIKIENHNNYNVTYGCVDNKNPKSIYVNITAWLEPISEDEEDYNKIIKQIDKRIRQAVYNFLLNCKTECFLKDKTIVDLDLRESGIKFGKRSYMSCEITLFKNDVISLTSEPMKIDLNKITSLIINEIFDKDKDFKYHKKK